MRIAVFQFASGKRIYSNFCAIRRAVQKAAAQGVRLLVFHECALCGYPPIERPDVKGMDFDALERYTDEVKGLAKKHRMYIALGTVRKEEEEFYNTLLLISPQGDAVGSYDKRALWGYDLNHFKKGNSPGIFEIDGIKIGFRICFEIRFPEYFRELFRAHAELCFVSFSDVSEIDLPLRYDTIKAHLITRAAENVMTVVSVDSISKFQTAPTAVFDVNGGVIKEAPKNGEFLLTYDYSPPEISYGAEGRIRNSLEVMG